MSAHDTFEDYEENRRQFERGKHSASSGRGKHSLPEEEKSSGVRGALDIIIVIAVAVGLTLFIRAFVVGTYKIPSQSMADTIEVNDRVFSERITYRFQDVQQGDIITFMNPDGSGTTLIKRVIATGGQTVDLIDGRVYVDGVPLDEPYTDGKPSEPLDMQLTGVTVEFPYTVPEGYLWVMGDNRTNSKDSRYFGAIPEDSVTGRAIYTYWPVSNMGKLE